MELPLRRNSLEMGWKPSSSRDRRRGWSELLGVRSGPLARVAGAMVRRRRQASVQRRRRCDVALDGVGTGMAFGAYPTWRVLHLADRSTYRA